MRNFDSNNERISRMSSDHDKFTSVAQKDNEGNIINAIKLDRLESADIKRIGSTLQEIAKTADTLSSYQPIGELYGFNLLVKTERILRDDVESKENRFFVEGEYKYTHNNGYLAMADPKVAAINFLKALEKLPATIEQYKKNNEQYERDIPILKDIVKGVWKKEDELKQLKTESAALERKIQLSLTPPKEEETEQKNKQSPTEKEMSRTEHIHSYNTPAHNFSKSIREIVQANSNSIILVRPNYGELKKMDEPDTPKQYKGIKI